MFFSVQVRDRRHLAGVMRALKRVSDVRRIYRART
jgi:(p)ppGpp synthase/HD superfamily hydrolase